MTYCFIIVSTIKIHQSQLVSGQQLSQQPNRFGTTVISCTLIFLGSLSIMYQKILCSFLQQKKKSSVQRFMKSAKAFHPHRELGVSGDLQAGDVSSPLFPSKTSPLRYVLCLVAQNRHHPGDWRLPGEEARRRGSPLHRPAHARLPGRSFPTTPTPSALILGTFEGKQSCSHAVSLCQKKKPAPAVQAGPQTGPHAGHPHPDPTSHHPGSVAVRQDP